MAILILAVETTIVANDMRIVQAARKGDTADVCHRNMDPIGFVLEEHVTLTYDLMHLAFQGDISRVFTFLTANEASNRGYPFIGISESHHVWRRCERSYAIRLPTKDRQRPPRRRQQND